jgi:hypothetical protein
MATTLAEVAVTTRKPIPSIEELPLMGSIHAYNRDRLDFLLATLAQRVTFTPVEGQRVAPNPQVTTRPRGDIQMVVRRRAPQG